MIQKEIGEIKRRLTPDKNCINKIYGCFVSNKKEIISKEDLKKFLIVLNPIAPHATEEVWSKFSSDMIIDNKWPEYDESKIMTDNIELAVQVNGSVKFRVNVPNGSSKEEIEKIVMADSNLDKFVDRNNIKKLIIVPGKIINFVV